MDKGIVSTGSMEATHAASEILRAGGNAFDAAVSAVFTSMTSEYALTGAGGGGAMMCYTPGIEHVIFDFFVDNVCDFSLTGFCKMYFIKKINTGFFFLFEDHRQINKFGIVIFSCQLHNFTDSRIKIPHFINFFNFNSTVIFKPA